MFLFSVTAQELKQALKGSGKIKLCLSGVLSQRRVVCLPPEPALHAFYEIAMPLFSLTASVPACEMAFGSWKPSKVLSTTCNAFINHNVQVPEPPKGRRRVIDNYTAPAGAVALVQKLLCFLVPEVLGSIKQERRLSVNHLSSLLATTFS